jgi:hypothetical protein
MEPDVHTQPDEHMDSDEFTKPNESTNANALWGKRSAKGILLDERLFWVIVGMISMALCIALGIALGIPTHQLLG